MTMDSWEFDVAKRRKAWEVLQKTVTNCICGSKATLWPKDGLNAWGSSVVCDGIRPGHASDDDSQTCWRGPRGSAEEAVNVWNKCMTNTPVTHKIKQ